MSFSIREVQPEEDHEHRDELRTLHDLTFFDAAPAPDLYRGHWWLVWDRKAAKCVAFAGLYPAKSTPLTGYLVRVGVLKEARGHGLQRRLLTVREHRARKNGWTHTITDTTDNPASANSLIGAGYRIFEPTYRWAFPHSIYWIKDLVR